MLGAELYRILKSDLFANRIFCGVYAVDKLPKRVCHHPAAYIINTDVSKGPGEHWVAVYFDGLGNAEFWDSYGFSSKRYPPISRFIKNNSFRQLHNSLVLQSPVSRSCGHFCLTFVLQKARGVTLRAIQSKFVPFNLTTNDTRARGLSRPLHNALSLSS